VPRIFTPSGNTTSIDVAITPQNLVLQIIPGDECIRVVNIGNQIVFFSLINTASLLNSIPILPGTVELFGLQGSIQFSVIAPATGSKVYVTSGGGM
jgi:hypothetical protein